MVARESRAKRWPAHAGQREAADVARGASGAGLCKAGIAVVHLAFVNAHPVRVGILKADLHNFQNLARLRIDLLSQTIGGEQAQDGAVIPIEPVRTIAVHGNQAEDPEVLGIHLGERVDAQRCYP